jgi:two-component sensor histidine kinase
MSAIGLALMPLAVLAYVQANRVQSESRQRGEAALFGETLQVAAPQLEAITRAQGTAFSLAQAVAVLADDPQACIRMMQEVVGREPLFRFAGYIPENGLMTCSSTGEPHQFSDSPQRRAAYADPRPSIIVNARGEISGDAVVIVSEPVRAEDGALLGFVSISVPHRTLQVGSAVSVSDGTGPVPAALITFNRDGTILTAMRGLEGAEARLPRDRALMSFVGKGATTFTGVDGNGVERAFAVVPLVKGELYVLSSWSPGLAREGGMQVPLWLFPAAMWLASLMVAWLAAEMQVLRHIRALRRSIIQFSRGSRTVDLPNLNGAPAELRDVGDAYEAMVEAILHDEAALENVVHQKEVLLREVHHRVKNNLQLIASIMNIQMRKAANPETKAQLKGLHDRVMSLATVHRELYQTSGLTDVQADELLAKLTAQVIRMGTVPGREIALSTRFDPIRLTPDQSVPLSLLLTEALTNVLKHARQGADGRIELGVTLERTEEARAALRVENSTSGEPGRGEPGAGPRRPDIDSTGLGEQLLQAFATQIGGVLTTGVEGDSYKVRIEFPVRSLAEAEQRFGPDD